MPSDPEAQRLINLGDQSTPHVESLRRFMEMCEALTLMLERLLTILGA
jgi:hypothetical protein